MNSADASADPTVQAPPADPVPAEPLPADTGAAGELLFQRYLAQHSYPFEIEPDLGITKRPDFVVTGADGRKLVAEVKSFDTFGLFANIPALNGNRPLSRSIGDVVKPIRAKIKEAAAQMSELKASEMPLVVVLANPAQRPVSLEPHIVISAMYGDLTYQANVSSDGVMGDLHPVLGRNGKLRNDHPGISAVVVVRREFHSTRWAEDWFNTHRDAFNDDFSALGAAFARAAPDAPEGENTYLEVFETLSTTAVPLPRNVFNGPYDLRWVPTPARDGLTPLAPNTEVF